MKEERKIEIYALFPVLKKSSDFDLPSRVYAAIGIQKSSATHSVTHEACRTYIKKQGLVRKNCSTHRLKIDQTIRRRDNSLVNVVVNDIGYDTR